MIGGKARAPRLETKVTTPKLRPTDAASDTWDVVEKMAPKGRLENQPKASKAATWSTTFGVIGARPMEAAVARQEPTINCRSRPADNAPPTPRPITALTAITAAMGPAMPRSIPCVLQRKVAVHAAMAKKLP